MWVNDDDIAILARRGVGVAHNPESNMKLASGVAPVPKYLAPASTLGLGTDGAASNNDLDMFEAMRQAAFLHKLETHDPRAVPAPRRWSWRRWAARASLGLQDRIGRSSPASGPTSSSWHEPARGRRRSTTRSRTSSTPPTATT